MLAQSWSTHITADDNSLAQLAQTESNVTTGGRFTFLCQGGGHRKDLVVFIQRGQRHTGTNCAHGLAKGKLLSIIEQLLNFLVILFADSGQHTQHGKI